MTKRALLRFLKAGIGDCSRRELVRAVAVETTKVANQLASDGCTDVQVEDVRHDAVSGDVLVVLNGAFEGSEAIESPTPGPARTYPTGMAPISEGLAGAAQRLIGEDHADEWMKP